MQLKAQNAVEGRHAVTSHSSSLTSGQIITATIIGLILWFAAAMTVRLGGPAGFFGPTGSLLLFAVGIPISWGSVFLTRRIARLQPGQTLPAIAIGLIAATFADGIVLTWFRDLYGADPAVVGYGAAWILWGVGLFLLIAYLEDRR